MLKVLIAGGRDFNDYKLLREKCNEILKDVKDDIIIISGKANGADTLGEDYAKERKYKIDDHPAKWDDLEAIPCKIKYNSYGKPYNALAGFNRNRDMVEVADLVICFWDSKSKGTKDTINLTKKKNKRLEIVNY